MSKQQTNHDCFVGIEPHLSSACTYLTPDIKPQIRASISLIFKKKCKFQRLRFRFKRKQMVENRITELRVNLTSFSQGLEFKVVS